MATRSIRPLISSWLAYWAIVGTVKLGPALLAIWRATRGPDDGRSSVNLSFDGGRFILNVVRDAVPTYTGSASLAAIALWFAGPPLAAWAVWLSRRRKAQREPA